MCLFSRRTLPVLVACFLMAPASSLMLHAQKSEEEITKRLLHQPLLLRTLPGEDNLKYDGDGKAKSGYKTVPFTVCGIDINKVQLYYGRLFLEGQRVGLVFDDEGNMSRLPLTAGDPGKSGKPEKISIMIDRTPNDDFSHALDVIFATNIADLVPGMPEFWQAYAKQNFLVASETAVGKTGTSAPQKFRGLPGVMHVGGNIQPPAVVSRVVPKFSEYARRMKFSRSVTLYMVVDETGTPTHISVAKPAGLGLDEQAAAGVALYKFAPAQKDGTPVKVDIYMDIHFEIH